MKILRDGYKVDISQPVMHVNNQQRKRSGHMSHAMVEFEKGKILAFNSNCSNCRVEGHAPYGWLEYRISEDYGESFGEPIAFPYAWQAFLDGRFTVSVEKAVVTDSGKIIVFCLRNTMLREICCEPWLTPTYCVSEDGGKTWSEAMSLSQYEGRVYDARYYDGVIYVLEHCINDPDAFTFSGIPRYRVLASYDDGQTFIELAELPIDTKGKGYGAMIKGADGGLHVFCYNVKDEANMDHVVSYDNGKTWQVMPPSVVKKLIRNPQINQLDGVFILFGRAGGVVSPFVFYTSKNGYDWDEGTYIGEKKNACYYSNSIIINQNGKNRLLMQYSDTYELACVNVLHRWVSVEKE